MWIRNKGSRAKPNFVLLDSRRVAGRRHPQQEFVCHMGPFRDFDKLIALWEMLVMAAAAAERKGIPIVERDNSNPNFKRYARGMTLTTIKKHLSKLKIAQRRYQKWLLKQNPSNSSDMMHDLEFRAVLKDLAFSVFKIRSDFPVSEWPLRIRKDVKQALREIALFYRRL